MSKLLKTSSFTVSKPEDQHRREIDLDLSKIVTKVNEGAGGTFTDLTDVPSSYAGEAGKAVVVNGAETGLEFAAVGGTGTVTDVSVVSANGLAGTVANSTTTPAITLTTSITGVLKGNGTAISAAGAGTDYLAPAAIGVTVQAYDADLTTWAGITPAAGIGTFLATPSSANLISAVTDETGTGKLVFNDTPTLIAPVLGTPTSGTLTNCTGTASGLTAGTVTTNANLTGHVTSVGNAAVLGSFTSLQLKTALTDETGSGANVFADTPTLVTPLLGTPTSGVLTNCTGLPSVVVANEATDTTCFPLFVTAATGELAPKTNANLAFNSNTGVLTLVAPILGTPTSGTLTNCTFPTLNQNTSGSAASLSVSGQTGLMTVTGLASTNRAKTIRDAADTILELGGSYTPSGTWTSMVLAGPTLTLATSSSATDARISWDSTNKALLVGNGTAAIEVGTSIIGGYQAVAGITVSVFQSLYTTGIFTSEAAVDEWRSPGEFRIQGFTVSVRTAPGAGKSWTATLRLNGSNTAITCQISGAATVTASDTTHSVSMAAGDIVTIGWVAAGSPADAAAMSWGAILHPDN